MAKTNWPEAMKPLLRKYRNKPHPLEYKNLYQLLVMVVLSAQDSDRNINALAPALFGAFPNMEALAAASEDALLPYVGKVRGHRNKTEWLIDIARTLKRDENIPTDMEGLVALKGIGRKSANVIMREAGAKAEGIVVDLHVVRVAPRIGIATGSDPAKIERQLMEAMPEKTWGEVGMAISFLGRETCRPSHPHHHECVVAQHCAYYRQAKPTPASRPVKKTVAKKAAAKTSGHKKAGQKTRLRA